MKRAAVVVAVIAIGISASGLMSQAQGVGNRSDEDMIRNVVVTMTEDFNRHDAKAATQMYAPDARFVTVRGEVMDGQPAVEKGMASIFGTRAKNASLRTLDVAVRFIRPDVALVHVTNELSGLAAPDGQALPPHQELSLRVSPKTPASGAWWPSTTQWSGPSALREALSQHGHSRGRDAGLAVER
jgi:uncharacterized protein (TIGR02246 family)